MDGDDVHDVHVHGVKPFIALRGCEISTIAAALVGGRYVIKVEELGEVPEGGTSVIMEPHQVRVFALSILDVLNQR